FLDCHRSWLPLRSVGRCDSLRGLFNRGTQGRDSSIEARHFVARQLLGWMNQRGRQLAGRVDLGAKCLIERDGGLLSGRLHLSKRLPKPIILGDKRRFVRKVFLELEMTLSANRHESKF